MVEKCLLAVFIMACALGLAVGLICWTLQWHVRSVCLSSLPTEPSPEGLPLGDFMFVQEGLTFSNFSKHPLIYSDSHFTLGRLEFCLGG